jgi:endonuclease YncB( thermonuclease family)
MSRKMRWPLAAALALVVVLPTAVLALTSWDAHVDDVSDGDTFDAHIDYEGDATKEADADVRITGIQAMELTDYSNTDPKGPCMGPEASLRLQALIEDEDVTLSALNPDSAGSRNRPKRFVSFDVDGDGDQDDIGHILVREGLALWSSSPDEWTKNLDYYKASKAAQRDKVGLWNPNYGGGRCTPATAAQRLIDMWIQWDADGPDGTNVNGEWVRFRNRSGSNINIAGWTFRDPSLSTDGVTSIYKFPTGATIPARRSIQLKVGKGTNVADKTYFWNQSSPKFENVDYSRSIGDGGYLQAPDGSMRASFMYPCMPRANCTDPLRGKVKVAKAVFNPDDHDELLGEYIDIKNVSARKVRLERYQLEVYPFNYAFGRGDVLNPNQVLRLWMKDGTDGKKDGRLVRYWGHGSKATLASGPILNNNGDWARLKSFEDVQIHCLTWGGKRCGSTN